MRNYDVGNAAEILSTGSYQRLPAAIGRAVPPPRLGRKHVRETLAAIGGIIRSRILRGEPVPLAMRRYTIANGRIVFTVPGEFEATLTLLQYEDEIPWHVVGVRVLVAGDASLPDEQQITVNTRQIVEVAQQILIAATNSDAESNPPQLVQFYDFLHRQCYTVLLETVLKQAAVLLRARWENLLHVEMPAGNRTVLVLRYWTLSRAAAAADPSKQQQQGDKGNSIVFRLTALPVPRPIHASALQGADQEDPEFELVEHDRRNLIPKIGLAVTWTAHSGLASPKVWTRTVSHADELATSGAETNDTPDFDLVLDPSSVNTERLLRQVTWQHARAILKSLHTQMLDSQLFGESAVELLYTAASGVSKRELTHDEALACTAVPCLRAWYRQNEGAVDITVDTYTGRLVVRASEAVATSTALSEAMVGQLTDQLNRQPWRVAALLVDMRSSLALADLDCLVHRSLGLRPQNNPQGMNSPALPGFVLSSVSLRTETAAHASQQQPQQQQPMAS
ncbi:mediator complex subunit, partial [Coemansia sp. RSA 2618]